MDISIIKILGVGTYKRFMWLTFNHNSTVCIRISDSLYCYLKNCGVPTSQSLRRK